jgi:hypothetical protein
MKILVDGEPTDQFGRPLEDETVGEFLDRVNEELSDTNRVISEARVDGELVDGIVRDRPCNDVESIKISLSTMEELTIDTIGKVGSYCHRYLDKIPEIVEDWESYGRDRVEEYRKQVIESLNAAYQLLTSVETLTNLSLDETNREAMMERAADLKSQLKDADPESVKTLLQDSIRSFYEELLETLQTILEELQERREFLVSELDDVQEEVEALYQEVQSIIEKAQKRSEAVSEWLNLEKVSEVSQKLTGVSKFFETLDQSGKLKTMVPSDRQEQFREELAELRDDVGKLFKLLEDRDPTEVIKTLQKEVQPHIEKAREFIDSLDPEADDSKAT